MSDVEGRAARRQCAKGHALDPNRARANAKRLNRPGVVSLLKRSTDDLIAIDGWAGAGKSHLASFLQRELAIPVICLDDMLTPGPGTFQERLRVDELQAALMATSRPAVVEGICMLETLKRIGITPNILIYVEAIDDDGQWVHMSLLQKDSERADTGIATRDLTRGLIAYHKNHNPHIKADYIVENRLQERWGAAMMSPERVQIDIQYIKEKTKLALALAVGGMLSLIVGLAVLLKGVSGADETLIKLGQAEVSAKGLGGVIMLTSSVWGYLAYKARPQYTHARTVSEKRDPKTGVLERIEQESDTAVR